MAYTLDLSGRVALGLPPAYARRGWFTPTDSAAMLDSVSGPAAVLSGSCSEATNAQVAVWRATGRTALHIDPLALHQGTQTATGVLAQARAALAQGPVLVYATAAPESVKAVQAALGVQAAGELVEHALAHIAQGLGKAHHAAISTHNRPRRDGDFNRATVTVAAHGFVDFDMLALRHPRQHGFVFALQVGGHKQLLRGVAQHLCGAVAKEPSGACIPVGDHTLQGLHNDGVV